MDLLTCVCGDFRVRRILFGILWFRTVEEEGLGLNCLSMNLGFGR